jgi:hypothetical protein
MSEIGGYNSYERDRLNCFARPSFGYYPCVRPKRFIERNQDLLPAIDS